MSPRTLAIFPGALGDFCCFLPALRGLCDRVAPVTLMGQRAVVELVGHWPEIEQILSIERPEVAALFGAGELEEARQFLSSFAQVYSWFGSRDPLFAANLTRSVAGQVRLLPFAERKGSEPAWLHYLRTLHLPPPRIFPLLQPSKDADRWAQAAWERWGFGGAPVLVMHPGAGAPCKRWCRRGFEEVAAWWTASRGPVLVLLGAAEAAEPWVCTERPSGRHTRVLRGARLPQVAAVLARARAYVGNDSGISHLAGVVGTYGVVLFGPSDPVRWRPLGDRLRVLRGGQCGGSGGISTEALSAESVVAVLERLAGGGQGGGLP